MMMSNEEENGADEVEAPTVISEDLENDTDAPELGISVGVEDGNVIVVFTQRLTTLGMPPEAAEKMANALLKHAADARAMRVKMENP
jgi:hypothetical protein